MNLHSSDRTCTLWIIFLSMRFKNLHAIWLFGQADDRKKLKVRRHKVWKYHEKSLIDCQTFMKRFDCHKNLVVIIKYLILKSSWCDARHDLQQLPHVCLLEGELLTEFKRKFPTLFEKWNLTESNFNFLDYLSLFTSFNFSEDRWFPSIILLLKT